MVCFIVRYGMIYFLVKGGSRDDFPDPNIATSAANTMPSVAGDLHDSNLISRCLIVLLTYFWTFFRVSDNAMEFLLSGLEKIFSIAAKTSNFLVHFCLCSLARFMPFAKKSASKQTHSRNMLFVRHAILFMDSRIPIEQLAALNDQNNVLLLNLKITGSVGDEDHVGQCC